MTTTELGKPGTVFGPCKDPCLHAACVVLRECADTICPLCEEPIGYGRRFIERRGQRVHTSCWRAEQAERMQTPALF